jgi:sugar fermentation stimulation protein A
MTISSPPILTGTLIKRYKRFLADVRLDNGKVITAHCPNSGSMKTCAEEGWKVFLSYHSNPKRKLAYTLELIHNGSCWICVNTHRANKIVKAAIENKLIEELQSYPTIRPEVRYSENSRIDLLLEDLKRPPCYVEIKSVTLLGEDKSYQFPDSVTLRGQKHIRDLIAEANKGNRAVLFFLILRSDGSFFTPAKDIDPEYARLLSEAHQSGVEILCYRAEAGPESIEIAQQIELVLPYK